MLRQIKVSVRISILTLFVVLLISVCALFAIIDYLTTERILLSAGKRIVAEVSAKTEHFVTQLFLPGFYLTNHTAYLINKGLITPGPTKEFTAYMLETMRDLPNNVIVAWGEPSGNYYEIERGKNNRFLNTLITCENQICTAKDKYVDADNRALTATKTSSWLQNTNKQLSGTLEPYDPRGRPWFKEALATKGPIITEVFSSVLFSGGNTLCMNSANPVFNYNGQVKGVFSVKTSLAALSQYLATIELTPNSVIFIIDAHGNVVATKNLVPTASLPTIEILKRPWVTPSLQRFLQKHEELFTYKYNGINYIAFYQKIPNLRNAELAIGIAMPLSDIVGFLNHQLFISLGIMVLILVISALIVWYLSNLISKPIINLADQVKQITYTNSFASTHIQSKIKEINYMQDAFNTMKRSLKSFARYVPFSLVRQLLSEGKIAHVGGENKELTCLFADIQDFTLIAEQITPKELMSYLSEYFDTMTKIIIKNRGTVDKYIGDAIMAFWGAPREDKKHALHACTTALQMQAALAQLNQKWQNEGKPQFNIRIGINSGTMIVGNVGSEDRLNFTILGDNVNLANRAENINKKYGTKIIATENTYQIVKKSFNFRLLDHVVLRGKTGINIYELLETRDHKN